MVQRLKGLFQGVAGKFAACAVAAVAVVSGLTNKAFAATTIPDAGVDWDGIATSGATEVGKVIASVIGIFVMVALVNMGIKWCKRAFTS